MNFLSDCCVIINAVVVFTRGNLSELYRRRDINSACVCFIEMCTASSSSFFFHCSENVHVEKRNERRKDVGTRIYSNNNETLITFLVKPSKINYRVKLYSCNNVLLIELKMRFLYCKVL